MAGKKGRSGGKHEGDQGGRPTKLTKELATELCNLIASGHTINQAAHKCGLARQTVIAWAMKGADPESSLIWFTTMYDAAIQTRLEVWADELNEIADDGSNDWYERESKDGSKTWIAADQEHINRSRLRVDTRKWLLSKLSSKKYGDKVEHTGEDGGPIKVVLEWAKKSG